LARGSPTVDISRSLVPLREPGVLFALNARLNTNTVSDTTTSKATVETAAAIRASA
jgi:hypothetical protein